ncbi:MAG: QueT transporter family protein [Clostridia bacterium]|nr:QueT transporter family protein [Clostridia bacterium]
MKKSTKNLVIGAVIAALYASLTLVGNIAGLSYGQIQFRISEALTVLPVFTPAAIPGLAVGCFISNIASFNPIDMIFGTIATLCAAFLSYYARNLCIKKIPVISLLSPVFFNALVVGAEISLFLSEGTVTAIGFLTCAALVGLGELAVCLVLGLPLIFTVRHNKILSNILE